MTHSTRTRTLLVAGAVLVTAMAPAMAARAAAPSRSDLTVVRLDPDPAPPGGGTTVHGFVANNGPDTTANAFAVTIEMPPGARAVGPFFPDNCQAGPLGHTVRCVFPAGLPQGRTATALIPARISGLLGSGTVLTGGSVTVTGPDDTDPANNRAPFTITVA
ncbi:hypothetical protein AB0K43_23345 [Kitasatospora sp. NPDC049258]|uniref:hypothetical protein n=1 Tax=Kitasatospora sp. NPDC049258 TaxID=3155394 RepID=UPI00341C54A1